MSNIVKTSTYRILSSDEFFFDANVWFFLFGPIANSNRNKQDAYADFLSYIRERQRPVHINSLVLSEFVNAWLRFAHKIWARSIQSGGTDYKRNYISTEDYLNTVSEIRIAIEQILPFATRNNDNFNAIQLPPILTELNFRDFNDNYYLQYASLKRLHIVTDDGDMFNNNPQMIKIITA